MQPWAETALQSQYVGILRGKGLWSRGMGFSSGGLNGRTPSLTNCLPICLPMSQTCKAQEDRHGKRQAS